MLLRQPLTFSSAVKTFQWLLSDSVNTFSVHGTGLERPLKGLSFEQMPRAIQTQVMVPLQLLSFTLCILGAGFVYGLRIQNHDDG